MKEGLNLVHLEGYVRGQPSMYRANTPSPVLRIKLAVPRKAKDGEKWITVKDLINIAVWGWKAKNLYRLLGDGSHIYVQGPLRYSTFMHKKLKQRVTTCYVQAEKVLFLGKKPPRR